MVLSDPGTGIEIEWDMVLRCCGRREEGVIEMTKRGLCCRRWVCTCTFALLKRMKARGDKAGRTIQLEIKDNGWAARARVL